MSFILEALKKSENKHRQKEGQNPPTIHEPIPYKKSKSRTWGIAILVFLLVNAALLLWFFVPWQQLSLPQQAELLSPETAPVNPSSIQRKPATVSNAPSTVTPNQHRETNSEPVVNELLVPRNEKKVYSFEQLPTSIQRRIPPMQMSLHAYHRDDSSASMVQLNDRIMRAGDMVADRISLEQITADGVVLRYDGYRFLLPRRGNQ